MQNENDKILQETLKAGMGVAARSGFLIIKAFMPLLAPLIVMLLFGLIAYTILFLFPKFLMDSKIPNSEAKIVTIFNLGEKDDWTEENDQILAGIYKESSNNSWQEDNESTKELKERLDSIFNSYIDSGVIQSQQEQAYQHRMPWSVLAGVDRIAGDPVTHREDRLRRPNPEKHYDVLKPNFTWKSFQVMKKKKTTTKDSEGNKHTHTETYTATIKLLDTADTFEAVYKYHWKENKSYRDGELWSVLPELESVEKNPPYYERLRGLMAEYGVTDDLEIETVLELAELYDDEYAYDASSLGTRSMGLQIDFTKQYYTGEMGETCLPVPKGNFIITSPYGMRYHPVLKKNRMHSGIDIGAPQGTPVYSAWDGEVIYTGVENGYGKTIIVNHGEINTRYAHLSAITCHRGQKVKSGDIIGKVGSTGMSTGPHLHFETFKINQGGGYAHENPMSYLQESN